MAEEQDSDRPPTAEEVAERLKDHKGITGSMTKEQIAGLMEQARAVPEISGNPDALNAFKADAAAKNAAHEAYRAAWTAQVAEAFANGTATVDKPKATPEAAPGADPLPRSRDDIVEGSRHAAREQAAAGGSKIDQYALAMEAAQQQEAVAAIPAHEAEQPELVAKGAALEGSLAAAWAKIEARTVGGEQEAMLRAAMARVRGTDAPAAAIPPREGWQDRMAATLAGKKAQTPGEQQRAALRARKAEAQARSALGRGFEP
jgi:hypothetical protein